MSQCPNDCGTIQVHTKSRDIAKKRHRAHTPYTWVSFCAKQQLSQTREHVTPCSWATPTQNKTEMALENLGSQIHNLRKKGRGKHLNGAGWEATDIKHM